MVTSRKIASLLSASLAVIFLYSCGKGNFLSVGSNSKKDESKPQTAATPDDKKISCKLTAKPALYVPGDSNEIQLTAANGAKEAEIEGTSVNLDGKGAAVHKISLSAAKTISAKVKKDNETATCSLEIKTIPDGAKFVPELALCAGKKGEGKEVLVIGSLPDNDVQKEITDLTGIKFISANIDSPEQITSAAALLNEKKFDAIWIGGTADYYMGYGNSGHARSTHLYPPSMAPIYNAMKKQTLNGAGVVFLADNEPFVQIANDALDVAFPEWNIKMTGNDQGDKTVNKVGFGESGLGRLFDHLITKGLFRQVSEGTSISYPVSKSAGSSILASSFFTEVLRNTSGNPTVSAIEKDGVRSVLHGGWTSLSTANNQDKDGNPIDPPAWAFNAKGSSTPQFFSNIACWTAGVK